MFCCGLDCFLSEQNEVRAEDCVYVNLKRICEDNKKPEPGCEIVSTKGLIEEARNLFTVP